MAGAATLATLPAKQRIITEEHLEPHDLLALRRSCKAMMAAAEDRFLTSFFTARCHIASCHGLETLAKIAADRRLVKKIRRIELRAFDTWSSFPPPGVWWWPWDLIERPIVKHCQEENKMLFENRGALKHISNVIKGLKAAKITPSIVVRGRCHNVHGVYGLATLRRKMHDRGVYGRFYEASCDRLNSLVLNAIMGQSFPIQDLQLGDGGFASTASITVSANSAFTVDSVLRFAGKGKGKELSAVAESRRRFRAQHPVPAPQQPRTRAHAPLKALRRLTLVLNDRSNSAGSSEGISASVGMLGKVFSSAINVKQLALLTNACTVPQCESMRLLGENFKAMKLVTIELCQFYTTVETITTLLAHFSSTLKKIKVVDSVSLDDDECWGTLCRRLADDFRLEQVELGELRMLDGAIFSCDVEEEQDQPPEEDNFHCILKGHEQIQSVLSSLASSAWYIWPDDD